jgi:hypothetical protein
MRIRAALGVPPPDKLDEVGARQLAVKQGVESSCGINRRRNGRIRHFSQGLTADDWQLDRHRDRARGEQEQKCSRLQRSSSRQCAALGDGTSIPPNYSP